MNSRVRKITDFGHKLRVKVLGSEPQTPTEFSGRTLWINKPYVCTVRSLRPEMTYQELRILVTIITYTILTLLLGRVDAHILLALILEHKNNPIPSYPLPKSWFHKT